MVLIDTISAFQYAIWHELTADEELIELMDDVRLRWVWAQPDEKMPYLVHRISSTQADPWVIRNGTYYLDIWDYHNLSDRILNTRKRCIELLDQSIIGLIEASSSFMSVTQPGNNETLYLVAARMNLKTDGFIPEEVKNIWHYAMEFDLRYTRGIQEIKGIIGDDS